MFTLYNQLRNVISYKNEFYLNKDGFYNIENNEMTLALNNFKEIYFFGQNIYFIWDINGNSILYDTKNKSINNSFKIDSFNYPYFTFYEFSGKSIEGIFNYYENTVLFESMEWLGRDIIDNYIFTDDITCRNVNNGNILWHFDLSQFGKWKNFENKDRDYEVEQFVGIANNCLYVLLSNFKLIALDAENGNLVQQLNLGEQFALEDRNWLSNSSKMHLDKVNNRMIWLTSATFLHIDLETFKANLIKDYFNVPLENLWRFKRSNFKEQQLLFTAQNGRKGGDPDIVGIMNPDTGEILWQYQITETQGLYEEPQLANNKLYVKSLDDILYIFEKE